MFTSVSLVVPPVGLILMWYLLYILCQVGYRATTLTLVAIALNVRVSSPFTQGGPNPRAPPEATVPHGLPIFSFSVALTFL